MSDFLGKLADQLNTQYGSSNETKTLELGDFGKQVDWSAHRSYVEQGYLRQDPYNSSPTLQSVLMLEPNATILIKKRQFSSLADNYNTVHMDRDEKLYYKTIKILFQNKCTEIAKYEKLSKIQKITEAVGNISDQLVPVILGLTDGLQSLDNTFSPSGFTKTLSPEASNFIKVADRIKKIYAFNTSSDITSWITDTTNLFQNQYGQGTGVIEITNFNNFSTTTTTDINTGGSFNLSIIDPYEMMLITEYDIEKAISDATNSFYNHSSVQFAMEAAQNNINDLQTQLNQTRASRKASPISLKINPDTLLGKKVVAIIDRLGVELIFNYDGGFGGIGSKVQVSDDYRRGGEIAGFDGLDTDKSNSHIPGTNIRSLVSHSELSIFQQLISAIFSKIQLDTSSANVFKANNQDTNYVRRKLRFNFCGKLIIQPMDTVHVYINSKSRYDNKLMTGITNMFAGAGILQNINKTLTNFTNAFTTLFNPSGNVNMQLEKSAFVGSDFPNYLWAMIRNQFVIENEGTHVFAGLVQTAEDNWSDGKYTVNVRGTDNTGYFEMGQVNFKPSADVFNGSLYDPLTPFKTKFDAINTTFSGDIPDLLDENKQILMDDGRSPVIKHKLGSYAGLAANADNLVQDPSVDLVSGAISKTIYAPDGLVYKWKEGIGVLTQTGSSLDFDHPNKVGQSAITNKPFAGQGVMDVISLLITGQPYNFANYWKSVSNYDGAQSDPQNMQNAAYSYYNSLKNDLTKNNITWGNFVPFKNLVVDEKSYSEAIKTRIRGDQQNQDLNKKLQKLSELNREAVLAGVASYLSNDTTTKTNSDKAVSTAQDLAQQINDQIIIDQNDSAAFSAAQNINTDTSVDFNSFIDSSKISSGAATSDPNVRRALRRQINYLTRRMSYNVRGNEDKNLFIVDDFYDKDYDIIAYEESLSSLELYKNNFTSVKADISNVCGLLNLEVFCDSQGHIRVRPPQYNKMPSSVFYKMMFLKKTLGVQVFPQFLEDLFSDQITALKTRLEINEDQIRLDCAMLGKNTDQDCMSFILTAPNGSPISGTGDTFSFLSGENTGVISDFKNIMISANPDRRDEDQAAANTFTSLEQQAQSNKIQYSNFQRAATILQSLQPSNQNKLTQLGYSITHDALSKDRINTLVKRIQSTSGLKVSPASYLIQNSGDQTKFFSAPDESTVDVFKVTQELTDKIRERQKVLKLIYGAIKNSQEFQFLDDPNNNTNQLLTPGNFNNSHVPEVFEHMIEDETYDDYGVGSGSRYVIKKGQIKSCRISEVKPLYTYVQVNGQVSPILLNQSDFSTFPDNGNPLVTAAAVDYDSWRNYGFTLSQPLNVPFLSNADTQVAPYAAMLLSRARKNVLQGSLSIAGNEFMQPGEVIYLEDRGLLFYVKSVNHSFTFNSSFTTTLELIYGHTPGEYIPEPLDVIGKLLYNNRDISNLSVHRQASAFNETNLGVIQRDADASNPNQLFDKNGSSNTTSFSSTNSQTLNNILYTAAYFINANNTVGNTVKAKIDIRYYYDDNNPPNSDLDSFARQVQTALTSVDGGPSQPFSANTGTSKQAPFDIKDVDISPVNMSTETDQRSPSSKALDAARGQLSRQPSPILANNTVSGGLEKDKLRSSLFTYIIDCWIKIEPVDPNAATGGSTNNLGVPNV